MNRLALAAVCLALPAAAQAETWYLTADAMVDVEDGEIIEDPAIIVRDGKIERIGAAGELDAPGDAETIDLTGYVLTPGLIDMHVHLTSDPELHGYRSLGRSDVRAAIDGVANARTRLMAGFTTVRNVGAPAYADVALRDAIAEGDVAGPRLFVSGPAIGITGGHCSNNNLLPPEYAATGEGVADGPWAARAAVRRNVKYGADLIKTCSTGGVLSKGTKVGAPQYTLEELTALTDEAHSHGLKVASHAHGAKGIKNALRAGIDTIEHASFIDDEGIRLARDSGAWLTMDIYVTEYILGEGEKAGILPESLEKERMTGRTQRENFRKAHEAGVKMLFGTDAGVFPHGQNARQLSRMVEFGMSPDEALRTATINAAEALGRDGEFGVIAEGQSADIIAVRASPLEDISTMESVVFVMKAGEIFKRPGD